MQGGSIKNAFLKILQNSQGNTCVCVSLLTKYRDLIPEMLL